MTLLYVVTFLIFATMVALSQGACSGSSTQTECATCRWPSNFAGVWCWTDDARSAGTCVESAPSDAIMASYANCWHLEGGLQFMSPYISSPTVSLPNLRTAVSIVWAGVPGTNALPQLTQVDQLSISLLNAATFDNFRTVKVVKDLILTCNSQPLTTLGTAFDESVEMQRIMMEFCPNLADIRGLGNLERMTPHDGGYSSITLSELPIPDLSVFAKLQNVDQLSFRSLSNLAPDAFSALTQLQPPTMVLELLSLPVSSVQFPAWPTTPNSWDLIDPGFGGKLILKNLPSVTDLAIFTGLGHADSIELQALATNVDLTALSSVTTCSLSVMDTPGLTNLEFASTLRFNNIHGYGGCGVMLGNLPDLISLEGLRTPISLAAAQLTGNIQLGGLASLTDLSPVTDNLVGGAILLMDLPLVTEAIFSALVRADDVMIWADGLETLAFPVLESVGPSMMIMGASVIRAYMAPGVLPDDPYAAVYYGFMLPRLCCANMHRFVEAFGVPGMESDGYYGLAEGCSSVETCHCFPHPEPLHGSLPTPFDDIYGAAEQSIICEDGYYLQGAAQVCAVDGAWSGPPQTCEACPEGAATCDATQVFTCLSSALPENGFCCNNDGLSCAESGLLSCVTHNGTCVPCASDQYFDSSTETCEACPEGAATCNATRVLTCLSSLEPENGFCCNNDGLSCAESGMLSCVTHNGTCVPCASHAYFDSNTKTCEACPDGAATCNASQVLTCLSSAQPENGFCCDNGGVSCAESGMLPCSSHDGACVPCASAQYFSKDTTTCEDCGTGVATCLNASVALTCTAGYLPTSNDSTVLCCHTDTACSTLQRLSCAVHGAPCGDVMHPQIEESSSTGADSDKDQGLSSSSSTGTSIFPPVTAADMQSRPAVLDALRLVMPLDGNVHNEQYLLNVTRQLADVMHVPPERIQIIGLLTAEDGSYALVFDLLPGTGTSTTEAFARLQAQDSRVRTYDSTWGVTTPDRLSILYICLIAAACVIVGTAVVIAVCWTRRRRQHQLTAMAKPPTPQRPPTATEPPSDVIVVLPVRSNNYMA